MQVCKLNWVLKKGLRTGFGVLYCKARVDPFSMFIKFIERAFFSPWLVVPESITSVLLRKGAIQIPLCLYLTQDRGISACVAAKPNINMACKKNGMWIKMKVKMIRKLFRFLAPVMHSQIAHHHPLGQWRQQNNTTQ